MSEHAPIGTKVRIITEGFGVHGHNLAIGDEGLDREDYEVIP